MANKKNKTKSKIKNKMLTKSNEIIKLSKYTFSFVFNASYRSKQLLPAKK